MSDYTIAVGPYTNPAPVQALTFYDSWTLDKNIDDGCTFTFTVPGFSPEAAYISELDTDVWVYRGGLLDQRFRIVQVNQSWGPSGEDVISVQAVCYRRLLGSRYVVSALQFDQISQGDIIWALIDHTQSQLNGDMGITVGDLGPTVLRDRTYEVGQNILDVIVDMTNVIGGPTWDIDENLELVVSRADLYPFNPAPIVLGATANALSRPSSASKFGNVAVVSGNGQETAIVVAEAVGLPSDPRGRWERRASYPSTVLQDTLQGHAEGLLTEFQAATTIWQVDVAQERYFSDAQYKLGDYVELVQPASTAAVVGQPATKVVGQVMAIQVRQSNSGDVDVSMRVLELGSQVVFIDAEYDSIYTDVPNDFRVLEWYDLPGSIRVLGEPLEVEYYILGSGGAGGGASGSVDGAGGGGGAGGVLTNVGGPLLALSGTYPVVPGSRVFGVLGADGPDGNPSSFGSLVALGGGGGGVDGSPGKNGASGGGAGTGSTVAGVGSQGFNGGASVAGGSGGGGGGISSAGTAGTTSAAGNGGAGVTTTIYTGTYNIGGGGAGGRFPGDAAGTTSFGGGASGNNSNGGNPSRDGAGGGGASRDTGGPYEGGYGGYGAVVIRWPV